MTWLSCPSVGGAGVGGGEGGGGGAGGGGVGVPGSADGVTADGWVLGTKPLLPPPQPVANESSKDAQTNNTNKLRESHEPIALIASGT